MGLATEVVSGIAGACGLVTAVVSIIVAIKRRHEVADAGSRLMRRMSQIGHDGDQCFCMKIKRRLLGLFRSRSRNTPTTDGQDTMEKGLGTAAVTVPADGNVPAECVEPPKESSETSESSNRAF